MARKKSSSRPITPNPDPSSDGSPRSRTISGPPMLEDESRRRIASLGLAAAFKFAEDSRRDADKD